VAFAFGLNATRLGFTPLESLFFSCIIYAGASQFVITAMLAAGSSLWVAALTVMAMDVRHVLYGPRCAAAFARAEKENRPLGLRPDR
jgi:predicted branched-subunit amino acid permease